MKKLMRKKLALMLASLRKKRKFFCEVEYLENTDKQYINTGLLSTANSQMDIVFGFTSMASGAANNCAVFGGRSNTVYTVNTFTFFKLASANPQNFRFDYNGQRAIGSANNMTWDTASKYRFTYNGTRADVTNITTNETDGMVLAPAESFTATPITLFGVNTRGAVGQNMLGRIYKCWYTDGTTTLDLIPVLDWNMRPAMYDKISGQFFYNAGTGEFSYGREVHYVDYLESTDTQWIDTKLNPSVANTYTVKVKTNFAILEPPATSGINAYTGIFGAGVPRFGAYGIYDKLCFGYSSAYDNIQSFNFGQKYNLEYTVTKGSQEAKLDGTSIWTATNTGTLNSDYTVGLFCRTQSTVQWIKKARLYDFEYYEDNTLVRDFKPMVDNNGVGAMFDAVTHTIFDNAGSGNFLYPPVELEYLVADGNQYIDTGIQPTDSYGYKSKNTYTLNGGEQIAVGCMDAGNRFVGIYVGGSGANISGGWGNFVGYVVSQQGTWDSNTVFDVSCNYKNDRKIIWNNQEVKDLTDVNISGTISNTIYLFARHYGSNVTKMAGKMWGVEITNGQNVVRDFVPAFKDGKVGMYDKVNGVLYENSGTGSFSVGKIVESEYE